MTTVCNKQIVREFIEATFARDARRVADVLADDMTYTIGGKHPRFQRVWTKPDWCRYLELPTPFEERLERTIHSITAEDDQVALEAESHGIISESGAVYNNHAIQGFHALQPRDIETQSSQDCA